MEKYYHGLLRCLGGRLKGEYGASDFLHDAYVRVLEASGRATLEHPQAYMYRAAINIAIDAHRRKVVRRSEPLDAAEAQAIPRQQTPYHILYQSQRVQLVERALGELSEACRTAFLMRKLDGLSHHEIAGRMGISRDMVEKHIVNAMKHCRVRVRELENEMTRARA